MKDKLLCVLLKNAENIEFKHGNFWFQTKHGWIRLIRNQKYIKENVETRKSTWFSKAIIEEQVKYIDEYNYRLFYLEDNFEVTKENYDKIREEYKRIKLETIDKELNKLCKNVESNNQLDKQ